MKRGIQRLSIMRRWLPFLLLCAAATCGGIVSDGGAAGVARCFCTRFVNQSGINKVDILFDIDNSPSMGDKQAYLVQAIPQMIARLVTPRCVTSGDGGVEIPVTPAENADPTTGQCTNGTPEFAAVHDMHIGVVTSSLGSRLGLVSEGPPPTYVCDPAQISKSQAGVSVSSYTDDQGHLINRTQQFGAGPAITQDVLPEGGGFLYWYPALGNTLPAVFPPTPYTVSGVTVGGAAAPAGTLVGDFSEIVGGAGESGCGIESQLESWYRFLIQPDPYLQLGFTATNQAQWQGVDTTIIQQRHDFLRPDSLVAIIVLTDENDSEIDVRSYQGSGWKFMSETYSPPRATSACAMNPESPDCATCSAATATDPACMVNGGVYNSTADSNDWGYNLNLRHVHMRQRFGLDPQFPLTRYYNGLTSTMVPNRLGEYPSPTSAYAGSNNCVNPLFAGGPLPQAIDVPDSMDITPAEIGTTLCNLTGPGGALRQPADVFYAHIGGVPHELLQVNAAACTAAGCTGAATDPASCATDCAQKDQLAQTDWEAILGRGASGVSPDGGALPPGTISYDYTGIDPHMIESMSPRNQLTDPPASDPAVSTLQGPALGTGTDPVRPDPINGREWITNMAGSNGLAHLLPVDVEYACIFKLPIASQRDCSVLSYSSIEGNSCDCVPGGAWTTTGVPGPTGNTPSEIPPLCSMTSTDNPPSITSSVMDYTVQTYAKAYPTIRELTLANMMGDQGIVSSLCPIHTCPNGDCSGSTPTESDPLYGYTPAVNAIVNRLKSTVQPACVQKLTPDGFGNFPCLVLVSFTPGASGAPTSATSCSSIPGGAYSNVDPTVLAEFNAEQPAAAGDGASVNLANDITCALNQAPVPAGRTCVGGSTPGWCYVTGAGLSAGSTCTQQLSYSSNSVVPNGATISLVCGG
jgi:hypothetical protein